MNLKPWREIAVPHADVHKGTFVQAEFAADISRVHEGSATNEYQDPELFFQRTFITEGMAALLTSVAKRLSGMGGDPVIQLQTAFGGGKTHTLLAVMHMVSGIPANKLVGVPELLKQAGVAALPKASVVVLDGNKFSPGQPRKVDGRTLNTLWGELAWQLGGASGYTAVAEADRTGTSPGKETLAKLIEAHSPCVILIDELVAYVRQFADERTYSGGTYDSNLSFVQALTEAMKATPRAALLASLPESDREAGSKHGIKALHTLEHYFGRVQAIWKPVSAEESFEIVRRRLFTQITDRAAADKVCRAFADCYTEHKDSVPGETQESRYYDRLRAAYPIHPELFERLYTDWSSLPNFQRTRGVLKLMARVIHRLWQDNNQDLLLMPGSLPLYDRDVHTELTSYLPAGWDPVMDHDVDGPHSEPAEIETRDARFGAIQACRRDTRTIFLGSAPGSVNEGTRGLDTVRIVLGCLQPGQQPHVYRDALGRLESRLTYLNKGHDRWWFDMRPNLRREMEERKRRFTPADVTDEIRDALQAAMGPSSLQAHIFTPAADIPDDWSLHLAVLSPDAAWGRNGQNPARDAASEILRSRGAQPRQKQNRLLFLAADADQVAHLKDTVRVRMAWQSIQSDVKDLRLTLDNQQQRQVAQYLEQTQATLLRSVRETFKWLVAPTQTLGRDGRPGEIEWDAFPLNPATPRLGREVDRALKENEWVISAWAPVHLHSLLKRWFWKDDVTGVPALEVWQKSCEYLYFPRLADSRVMQAAISEGANSRDFFGIAMASEGKGYQGFSFGESAPIHMDAAVLIAPVVAAKYEEGLRSAQAQLGSPIETNAPAVAAAGAVGSGAKGPAPATNAKRLTRYFGTVELDPDKASLQFSTLTKELIGLFTATPGTKVTIKVDIEASDTRSFDEVTVRAVKENAKTLKLKTSGFE